MLQSIQNELQSIYQISCDRSVEDFLLSEEKPVYFISHQPWLVHSDEALFVEQSSENLDLGLWLKPELLQWSENQSWEGHDEHITDSQWLTKTATLIEGVSHFVYLLWRVEKAQNVTQLELELQAEVDKFVLLSKCFGNHCQGELMDQLFENVTWNPHLGELEQKRYSTAVKFASQYCDYLRQHSLNFSEEKFLPEIRSFYRMNQAEKIRHIS